MAFHFIANDDIFKLDEDAAETLMPSKMPAIALLLELVPQLSHNLRQFEYPSLKDSNPWNFIVTYWTS